MDYSYLNQATFDSSCLQSAAGMDPTGLTNMPCSYSDLTSCGQMSQAAYRYTAAAASMARTYNPTAGGPMGVHHSPSGSQCAVMGTRSHVQDVHRAAGMFSTSMNLQIYFRKSIFCLSFTFLSRTVYSFSYFQPIHYLIHLVNYGDHKDHVR
ncbi:hypothetical protein ABEB36_013775 [Hypothenemus hampei]|uniref:Uncharacterized protein n=1 Tax=Hypothenemus hampei TaxID=57062 RepID=A0ABD1E588_HYPHA